VESKKETSGKEDEDEDKHEATQKTKQGRRISSPPSLVLPILRTFGAKVFVCLASNSAITPDCFQQRAEINRFAQITSSLQGSNLLADFIGR
jgi:hypothetical protein